MLDIVTLSVSGGATEAADLAAWLDEEDVLRGRVRREVGPVPDGALGGELQQLVVGLTSGGVATAVASVIVAWLRRRTGSVTVRVSGRDGFEVEVRADQVRNMDAEQLRAQVDQLVSAAWSDGAGREPGGGTDGE
ncbi:effector-associated constant component EACC1 [Streptomyces sp. NPDC001340]